MSAPGANPKIAGPRRTKGEGPLARMVNLGGVVGAAALMAIAVVCAVARGNVDAPIRFDPEMLRRELASGNAAAYAAFACVLLVITPALRVLILAVYLAMQRRVAFAILGFCVLALLGAALWWA